MKISRPLGTHVWLVFKERIHLFEELTHWPYRNLYLCFWFIAHGYKISFKKYIKFTVVYIAFTFTVYILTEKISINAFLGKITSNKVEFLHTWEMANPEENEISSFHRINS